MKKARIILIPVAALLVICIIVLSVWFFMPSKSVWDIAKLIKEYNDNELLYIADRHYHFLDEGKRAEAADILNDLKLSDKVGEYIFPDNGKRNQLTIEKKHDVQYFFFNEDFTEVWCFDSDRVNEYMENSAEPVCDVYRVKNPWKIRKFFKDTCKNDPKSEIVDSALAERS